MLPWCSSGRCCWSAPPSYPWYCLPLVVLAVLAWRLEWLAVPAAAQVAYAVTLAPAVRTLGYGVAAIVVVSVAIWRRSGTGEQTAQQGRAQEGGSPG